MILFKMSSEHKITSYDKVMKTIKEMLKQRKYKIVEEDDEKIIAVSLTEDSDKIYVFKQIIRTFNIKRVKQITSILESINIKHCITIYKDSATPAAKKCVNILHIDKQIELFIEKELKYNITKHVLVPEHIELSNEESKAFKLEYGTKLPIILKLGPISRFYNYKIGNVIKIVRKSKNGANITYRIVQ